MSSSPCFFEFLKNMHICPRDGLSTVFKLFLIDFRGSNFFVAIIDISNVEFAPKTLTGIIVDRIDLFNLQWLKVTFTELH